MISLDVNTEPFYCVQGDTYIQDGTGIDEEHADEFGIWHVSSALWGFNSAFKTVRPHYGVSLAHIGMKGLLVDSLLIIAF